MATFVLVPGYWLGAWAWDEVAAVLRAAGHDLHAVTPAGQAERADEAAPGTGVDTHIADIVRAVEDGGPERVVLVAHSGANMAATGACDRIPVPPFDPDADPDNLAGLTAGQLAAMRERGTPQPFGTATQALTRPDPPPATPRTLIASTIPLAA